MDLDALNDDELIKLAEDLEAKNDLVKFENTFFEAFYNRHIASSQKPIEANEPEAPVVQGKKKKKEKVKHKDDLTVLLTAEQKLEIVKSEIEEHRKESEQSHTEWTRISDNLRAEMEELEFSISESKKSMFDFKRDIVHAGATGRTGKVFAERVIRYFEDTMRSRDTMLGKIRLKNSTLKAQKNKLLTQLKQKEEIGDVLHTIDFDQLKIENKQYMAKIEERNTELLKLKMSVTNISQTLNSVRNKLNGMIENSTKLNQDIQQRSESLKKMLAEGEAVEKERQTASKINTELGVLGEQFSVPSVMSYVRLKAEQQDLENKLKAWRRKVNIAQRSLEMQSQKKKPKNSTSRVSQFLFDC